MYLGGIKGHKKYGIAHELGNLPSPLPEQELIYQIKKLREGDIHARDIIIMGHMRLGVTIAARYASYFPDSREDILAEMYCGILDAIGKVDRLKDNGISGWIVSHIHGHIANFLRENKLIHIPRSSDVKHYFHSYFSMEYGKEDEDNTAYVYSGPISILPFTVDDDKLVVTDFLNHLSKREAKIVQMKMEGYTDREIASKIGLTASRIGQILKEVAMIWERKHGLK